MVLIDISEKRYTYRRKGPPLCVIIIVMNRPRYLILWIVLAVLLILVGCTVTYLFTYRHADTAAIASYTVSGDVSISTLKTGDILVTGPEPKKGLIFYPGWKIEYTAYEPLMMELAAHGFLCVIVKMPLNIPALDPDAADGIQELFPEIETWLIGGHGAGGRYASQYLGEHIDDYYGLVLLSSYCTVDISETMIYALCMYGSNDEILDRGEFEENWDNLPYDAKEVVISGGNYAGFAMYGSHRGDGEATLPQSSQIRLTATEIEHL